MIDAPIMQNADAPTCQPLSAVGSFYRRTPNPRIVAGAYTYGDSNTYDTELDDPDLFWDGFTTWHLFFSSPLGSFGQQPQQRVVIHASSPDLASWTISGPSVFGSAFAPTVARRPDGKYLMVYEDGGTLKSGGPAATPFDGFGGGGVVLAPSDVYPNATGARLGDPELVIVGNTYHLWFSSQDCANATCTKKGIGHATSTDGSTWTLDAAPVPSLLRASADPSSGGIAPSVIYDEAHCRFEMWFENDLANENTNQIKDSVVGIYHATSTNGTSWTVSYTQLRDLVADGTAGGEHLGMRSGADVAMKSSGRYLLYTGFDDQNVPANATLTTTTGTTAGVMTLNLATRDAPP
ncbi:MAG TPA: hypothetical protein VL856_20300 [Acidimicrobiia bacterium]|nr:hypothetical protein [Acidimicrobiia bacterium]